MFDSKSLDNVWKLFESKSLEKFWMQNAGKILKAFWMLGHIVFAMAAVRRTNFSAFARENRETY